MCHHFPGHSALNIERVRYDLWCRLVAEVQAIQRQASRTTRSRGRSQGEAPGRIHARR